MTNISIIGTGTMGQAIAGLARQGGHGVQLLGRADTDQAVTGEVVVLAVAHPAVAEVLAQRGDQLTGKIVVDITNPVDFATFDGLVVPGDSSKTAELAAQLPESRVLKAFNTTFGATLVSGVVGDNATTVLIAGDDTDAKATLAAVVTDGGLQAIDAGSLKRARELEALGFLHMTLAAAGKCSWTGGFAVVA